MLEVNMKKIVWILPLFIVVIALSSCGEAAPVKEMEDAKTAIERAKSVDAPVYAEPEFKDAEEKFNTANDFLSKKKTKEAKENAILSKEKADLSYNLAITNRAVSIYTECSNLFVEIDGYFGNNVDPDTYEKCNTEFVNMGFDLEAGKVEIVYESGKNLKPKLEGLLEKSKSLYDEVSGYISDVEKELDELKENKDASSKAPDILDEAQKKLDEAKEALGNGEYDTARQKAKEADELCKQVSKMLVSSGTKKKEVKQQDKEKVEKDMEEAMDAIKRAKEKQQKLEQRKKILYKYNIKYNNFAISKFELFHLADEVTLENDTDQGETEVAEGENTVGDQSDVSVSTASNEENAAEVTVNSEDQTLVAMSESEEEVVSETDMVEQEQANAVVGDELSENDITQDEEVMSEEESEAVGETEATLQDEIRVKDEDITEEMVNKYISIAQELYDKGEYSKSLLYANEAIRMADVLLEKDYTKYYRVKRGDCLWNIAKFFYKNPVLWPVIYKANKNKIKHPDLIYPKQVFEIPPKPKDVNIKKLYKEINYKPLFR